MGNSRLHLDSQRPFQTRSPEEHPESKPRSFELCNGLLPTTNLSLLIYTSLRLFLLLFFQALEIHAAAKESPTSLSFLPNGLTAIACEKFIFVPSTRSTCTVQVKSMSELSDGYNIVGLSQGNMVARGVIEFCDGGPTVKNYVSIAGPHAGIASVPLCGKHLAPSNYVKIPTDFNSYMEACKFLPKLNNEAINMRNSTYKERFASLENLVLIMFEKDTVLVPKETSWFGYYPDGSFDTVLPANETKLYTEDWIGLKTLDEAGKVQFIGVPGNHLAITESMMKNYVVPYLEDESSTKPKTTKSEDNRWASACWNFIERIVRFTQNEPLFGRLAYEQKHTGTKALLRTAMSNNLDNSLELGTPPSSTIRKALPGLKARFQRAPAAVSWTS
ncbi:hypothetical protein RJ641_016274 [Dillenia turbinata]|uniref:Palmitoyl-protein thioesterase 1 n=1 Tax=Dillenia turbinata TaxID=194707 RepID=A0AAN8Z231_9MAGN